MKKIILMTGLLAGLGLCTMAQTSPASSKKEKREAVHHKSDSSSKAGAHVKKNGSGKKMKDNKN